MPRQIYDTSENETWFPDWPPNGDIDLSLHDLPHKSSTTEWWYLNTHVRSADGRSFSLFASFFRRAISVDKKNNEYHYSHTVLWALSDLDEKKYYTRSLVDPDAPRIGIKSLKDKKSNKDPFIAKAAIEILKKGKVPLPDELLIRDPVIPWDRLELRYDDQTYIKQPDGSYQLTLSKPEQQIYIHLNFFANIQPVRHGKNGVIYNAAVEDMFYYFIPNCHVKGTIHLKNQAHEVMGTGWYDHEFGARPASKKSNQKKGIAWNWIAVQLEDGHQLTVYDVQTKDKVKDPNAHLILIDPTGTRSTTTDYTFDAAPEYWVSTKTFNEYPLTWRLFSKSCNINIELIASFPEQEFGTVISKPAFWEGSLNVQGYHQGKKIKGHAYLERHGHTQTDTIQDFLKSVTKETLKSVRQVLPKDPSPLKLEELVSKAGNKNFIKNLDRNVYIEKLIKPIREIVDRGGKSWRSYATVACCDVVGGNSQEELDWLSLPELIHVGSLIVDDVQDKSSVRRGGPTIHKMHGDGIAINSGCAAYFIGQVCIYNSKHTLEKKVQIYNWYFEAMRASHSGQALDIYGLDYLFPDVINLPSLAKKLPGKVLAIHKLKSAAPASYLARIGACLGGGTEEQINALADFFEALGISFQIIDDVLNLKGFENKGKTKAEDITAGKITYPIAIAMSLMSKAEKSKLYSIIKSKTKNQNELNKAFRLITKYPTFSICEKYAKQKLEKAWKKLDPLIEDSMVKMNLRAFSWFVLERTY